MEELRAVDVALLERLPWLPSDYVEWLHRFGFGDVGGNSGTCMIYSAPMPLSEVSPDAPREAWTIGDDYSGYNACFLEGGDGTVQEWDSAVSEMSGTGQRFPEFVAKWRT
jgi:hypothetical protein